MKLKVKVILQKNNEGLTFFLNNVVKFLIKNYRQLVWG